MDEMLIDIAKELCELRGISNKSVHYCIYLGRMQQMNVFELDEFVKRERERWS